MVRRKNKHAAGGWGRLLLLLTAASCAGIVSCRRAGITAASFERWFVGADGGCSRELLHATAPDVDSVVGALRRKSPSGTRHVILHDTAGHDYTVGFRTPASIRYDTAYPCVIYLHGGTGCMRTDKGDSAFLMLDMLSDSMELFLASPSANRQTPWWSPVGLSRILQTLRYMTVHYPINREKVFCAGVSDGATGCWAAANTIAAPFAGFIAVSGFGGILPETGCELHPENLMQRPIYNVNAGNDRLYPIATVNRFLDAMERAGVRVGRKIYPDEEHGFDYRLKEAGTLCALIREWSLPRYDHVHWNASSAYPATIDHCIAADRAEGAMSYTIHGFCRNDTFFLRTSGLSRLRMYFEAGDHCMQKAVVTLNDHKRRRYKPVSSTLEMKLILMKQRCFPVSADGLFFSISL
ncbi:MAG: dienelactone hydrolase family protein [Chitinispirillaceae bacterium]|nr:dienelactone hydrolase family protein [Chitinispirillaceae bacterium]